MLEKNLGNWVRDRFQIYCCGGCNHREGYFERMGRDLYPRYKCCHPESDGSLSNCPFLKTEPNQQKSQ